jgi:hypothetical protein
MHDEGLHTQFGSSDSHNFLHFVGLDRGRHSGLSLGVVKVNLSQT